MTEKEKISAISKQLVLFSEWLDAARLVAASEVDIAKTIMYNDDHVAYRIKRAKLNVYDEIGDVVSVVLTNISTITGGQNNEN